MEEETRSERQKPKQPNVLATSSLQINEGEASRLVGSIVEKGISENKPRNEPFSPIPPPRPTVLPFPVARHRSDGPHWKPMGSKVSGKDDDVPDYEDDDEENKFMNTDSVAAFAKPVQRKEKKDMEFQRWKELVFGDDSASTKKMGKSKWVSRKVEKQSEHRETIENVGKKVPSNPSIASVDVATAMEVDTKNVVLAKMSESHTEFPTTLRVLDLDHSDIVDHTKNSNSEDNMEATSRRGPMIVNSPASIVTCSGLNGLGSRQVSSSLESEIDAENRARLQKMSPEEIAEAQAEIMEKMDPALLNLLKKRGQDKLQSQKYPASTASAANSETKNVKRETQVLRPDVYSEQSQAVTSSFPKITVNQRESSVVQNLGLARGIVWDTWTKRVEAVRDLRFSLDGVVVEDGFIPATDTCEKWSNIESAAERDFLRTEGDPSAAGYTIKEAIALARSAVPGQRSLALHLLASVLDKALHNICKSQSDCTRRDDNKANKSTDWEAIWAYALGPEPELILALRMALDDNHSSVVLACARVIQCVLSCDLNENFFDISEKITIHGKDIFTAPVFRSKPEIDFSFLRGGYWKYSAKPSNIFPPYKEIVDDGTEDSHTIQDDVSVAGQDVAAGLVRMEILPRIHYLLEIEPTAALKESIISILIAIARHSPTSADAIMKFPRLLQTIVNGFNSNKSLEVRPSQTKSVCLLKVLARFDKRNCVKFVKNGSFKEVTWHLYQYTSSLDSWVKLGKENCKLSSALMVEQLRFWKVCVQNGCCISSFPELFPTLCLWLNPPTLEKLMEKGLVCEFASVSKESYLVLEALAGTLPNIYSQNIPVNDSEAWAWSYVGPMINIAMSWISSASKLFEWEKGIKSDSVSITSLLWVYSAIMRTISKVLEKVTINGKGEHLPWLPEFVPKIGLEIINNRFLSFSVIDERRYAKDSCGCSSFLEALCCLRQQPQAELSLAAVSCLHGLTQVVASIENLIQFARSGMKILPQENFFSREESVLAKGILTESLVELRYVWNIFKDFVASEWPLMQSIEVFGRGGPAPGVGLGWGACGGGFWSTRILLAEADADFLCHLLHIFHMDSGGKIGKDEEPTFMMERINSALALCLIAGPRVGFVIEKALDFVLQTPTLEYLARCIKSFCESNKTIRNFRWEYKEDDFLRARKVLASHFRNRWLGRKRKSKAMDGVVGSRKATAGLETIHEDTETSDFSSEGRNGDSLVVEWARQRLPLPLHWFFSAISTIHDGKNSTVQSSMSKSWDVLEVAKAGIFFLLGIEAMSSFVSSDSPSPVLSVPLVWKLHALSAILLTGMDVLEDETTRSFYESVQELYGQFLNEERSNKAFLGNDRNTEFLGFKLDIQENYSTFLETLIEQYAAVSYGDIVYGRQVCIYLHQCVEPSVRLAAWNVLSNARVLELLPPLQNCLGDAKGYLEPAEDNEAVLEAYLKSWTSGALDKAAGRGSVAFTIVRHHFSSFIFNDQTNGNVSLRNKLVKSLLRDYSRKQHHEGMMQNLLQYNKQSANSLEKESRSSVIEMSDVEKKFEVLKDACKGNHSLVSQVEKLKFSFHQRT